MQATFSGVKNRTAEQQVLCYDGKAIEFKPGEVRILESALAEFASKRMNVRHKIIDENGRKGISPTVEGIRLFEIIPLEDALKVARIEENPSVVEARERAAEKESEKKALVASIMDELKSQGWKPPRNQDKEDK